MNNWRFILISVAIFLIRYLFSVLWPFLLSADIFVIWALSIFFLEKKSPVNPVLFWGVVVFFDFWSGSSFGVLSLALVLTCLLVWVIKKVMLVEGRSLIFCLVWLAGFYYLNIFIQNGFSGLIQKGWIIPKFSPVKLAVTIFWIIVFSAVFKLYEKKRISSFQL